VSGRIRVLVVDDSPLFIDALTVVLEADGDIEVVGSGANGREAVDRVRELSPSLVAMDVQMPLMDGLEAVEQIMASQPTPILLLTGNPSLRGERAVFEALSRGALDLVAKDVLGGGEPKRAWLRDHVRLLASVPVVYRRRPVRTRPIIAGFAPARRGGGVGLVASTGGPPVVADILSRLPPDFPLPILIVQHLAAGFAPHLVSWLQSTARLEVRIAEQGVTLAGGTVYVAPDGAHLTVGPGHRIGLDGADQPGESHRPSGSLLLSSMARAWGRRAIGVVLTGMGADGAAGLFAIRRAGGLTIAQNQTTSTVFGMPRAARDLGAAEHLLDPPRIAEALCRAAHPAARPE
jgi:two-component system, chemotaxis family, protein-glutamate methylesterase/glutaminase